MLNIECHCNEHLHYLTRGKALKRSSPAACCWCFQEVQARAEALAAQRQGPHSSGPPPAPSPQARDGEVVARLRGAQQQLSEQVRWNMRREIPTELGRRNMLLHLCSQRVCRGQLGQIRW